jgi:hypothetical protein
MATLSISPERTLRMSELAELAKGRSPACPPWSTDSTSAAGSVASPSPPTGRYTLAVLNDAGWDKVFVVLVHRTKSEPQARATDSPAGPAPGQPDTPVTREARSTR